MSKEDQGKKTAKEETPGGVPGSPLDEAWVVQLVEASTDLVCLCEKGRVKYMNQSGLAILGANRFEDVENHLMTDFAHRDYAEIMVSLFDFSLEETDPIPLKFRDLKGGEFDAEVIVQRVPTGGPETAILRARDITERVRSAERLRNREELLQGIMETVADGIVTADEKGKILSFNRAAERIFGHGASQAIGRDLGLLMGEGATPGEEFPLLDYIKSIDSSELGTVRELTGYHLEGTDFPLELGLTELRRGRHRIFTCLVRDITQRKEAETALRKARDELEMRVAERTRELTQEIEDRRSAEDKLRLAARVIESTSEGVLVIDRDYQVTSVNPAYVRITGYSSEELVGQEPPFETVLKEDPIQYAHFRAAMETGGEWSGELWTNRKDGEKLAERISISAINDAAGQLVHYTALISDITKRKEDEEQIHYQANYDQLTGLPNRNLFLDRLTLAVALGGRALRPVGLMFLDLDGFKLVNDTLGHEMGDLLLREAALRLKFCVRGGDTVARLGGDEFTILMPRLADSKDASIVAQRILDTLGQPFVLGKEETYISGSIGITVCPDDGSEPTVLLKNADAAMYRAKDQGKNDFQFFTADLNAEVKERLILKNSLSRALELDEYQIHYQPKLDIKSGQITGVEALLRWNSKDLGPVSPARFIPVLEETGAIAQVGIWTLRAACAQHRAWRDAGFPEISVAVNLSVRQLRQADLVEVVEQCMADAGIGPEGLEVEITESLIMSDTERAVEIINQIHDLGIKVSMDDFGTGYSSLSYLKRFPIDTIKIDQTFVADIATNPDDVEIIRTIINMGHSLRRRVIAEGVETEEQLAILREFDCHEMQGYLFSRPLPAEELTKFLEETMANGGTALGMAS